MTPFNTLAARRARAAALGVALGLAPGVALGLALGVALGVALGAAALSGARADPGVPSAREVIGYAAPDMTGPSRVWTLPAEAPYLYVPYVGDEVTGSIAAVQTGSEVGVALFQRPYFASRDLGCAPDIGSDARSDLKWLGATARFEPRAGRTPADAARPHPKTGGYASLIVYRKDLGPPPGVLLLHRRRTIGAMCRNPVHKTFFDRIFVPMAALPEAVRCFDLAGAYRYEGSEEMILKFTSADRLVLLMPSDLHDRYAGLEHRVTATVFDDLGCTGRAVSFKSAASARRAFRLSDFNFRDKARSIRIIYESGPLEPYLAPPSPAAQIARTPPRKPPVPEHAAAPATVGDTESTPGAGAGPTAAPKDGPSAAPQTMQAQPVPEIERALGEEPAGATAEPVPEVESAAQEQPGDTAARPARSERAQAETAQAETARADTIITGTVQAETIQAATTQEEIVKEATVQSETVKAATAQAETTQAEPAEPARVQPQATRSKSVHAERARPKAIRPEPAQAETERAEIIEPAPSEAQSAKADAGPAKTARAPTAVQQALPKLEPKIVPPVGPAPSPAVASQTFRFPVHEIYRLNFCLNSGTDCGGPAAAAWCKAQGFQRASDWKIDENIGALFPTIVIGEDRVCAQFACDGFLEITCAR